MIWWLICVLLLSLQAVSIDEYETMQFKDEVKVEGFAFSENEKTMIVLQDFYFLRGTLVNLPNRLYKKGEKGY